MYVSKTQNYLFFLFGFSLPLRGISVPNSSLVTLSDILFFGLVVACFGSNKWGKVSRDLFFSDLAFVALLLWSVMSIVLSPVAINLNAITRESFLALLFLFFRLGPFDNKGVTCMLDGYILGCVATALAGLLGVIFLTFFEITNPWAYDLKDYPYLDGWARAQGLSLHPNMLANFLTIALILSFLNEYSLRFSTAGLWLLRLFLVFGCVLALSRSMLAIIFAFLIAGCMFIPSVVFRRTAQALVFLMGFSFIFASANLVIEFSQVNSNMGGSIAHSMVSHGSSIFSHSLGDYFQVNVYRSVYLELKKTALDVFYNFPLSGIGDGNFYRYLAENSKNLDYPVYFPPYNPHSTYFGLLSETGIIGFFIFLVFAISIIICFIRENRTSSNYERLFWISVIYLAYEGINTDQLNFRHYIIFLALYLRSTLRQKVH